MANSHTIKIAIGWTSELSADGLQFMPKFVPPANYKNPEAIAVWADEKEKLWRSEAARKPYVGRLTGIYAADLAGRQAIVCVSDDKASASAKFREWLGEVHPAAWAADDPYPPLLIGFDVRTFLKMLGLECSMPGRRPCPPHLWYGNSDHRDIAEAVCPDEFKLDLRSVLRLRRPPGDEGVKWDKLLKDWTGPGMNPQLDAAIATALAGQLDLITGY